MTSYRFLHALDDPIPDTYIDQITSLYRQAGWWESLKDDPGHVRRIISGSHFFLVVIGDSKVTGMGRVISDRESDAYIQDVTVLSTCRKRGIGTQIVKHLVDRIEADGLKWIGLIAEKNTYRFYERIGFQKMQDSTPMKKVHEQKWRDHYPPVPRDRKINIR